MVLLKQLVGSLMGKLKARNDQMNYFLCASSRDYRLANIIKSEFEKHGCKMTTSVSIESGESFFDKMDEALNRADKIFVLLTECLFGSAWLDTELNNILLSQKHDKIRVIRIDNAYMPSYLYCIETVECSSNKINYNDIIGDSQTTIYSVDDIFEKITFDKPITLFCGAGISNCPKWEELLCNVINEKPDYLKDEINEFQKLSPQVQAKYLQVLMKDDFYSSIERLLYSPFIDQSSAKTRQAVSNFCKKSKNLESVITTNFDLLLEESLPNKLKTISKSIGKNVKSKISVYHVHGIIKRNGESSDIVFDEDSYNKIYASPYDWANIIQLEKFVNNICIFIGASLTDTNVRRLIEYASKIKRDKKLNLIQIKKKNTKNNFVDRVYEMHLNSIGVQVVWINTYDEIAEILECILKKECKKV